MYELVPYSSFRSRWITLKLVSCYDYTKSDKYLIEANVSLELQTQVCFSINVL